MTGSRSAVKVIPMVAMLAPRAWMKRDVLVTFAQIRATGCTVDVPNGESN